MRPSVQYQVNPPGTALSAVCQHQCQVALAQSSGSQVLSEVQLTSYAEPPKSSIG